MLRSLLLLSLLCVAAIASAQDEMAAPASLPGCTERQLSCGTSVDAVLAPTACVTGCGETAEAWRIQLFVQTTLATLTATSAEFDPRLELFDTAGNLIASNDRVGGGTNARISQVLEPGAYLVRVVGQPAGARGDYRLSLHCLLSDRKNFCFPDDETICLGGRFSFKLAARAEPGGVAITPAARPQSELHGFFSFPSLTGNADNPEVFVKLIDGRAVNGRWWVFWGGLTGLDYEITVRDSFTRTEKRYRGQGADTVSFADP